MLGVVVVMLVVVVVVVVVGHRAASLAMTGPDSPHENQLPGGANLWVSTSLPPGP
jgi:hypothetical protein